MALLGYGVIKLQSRRRRKLKAKQEMTQGKNYDKLCMKHKHTMNTNKMNKKLIDFL